MVVTFTVYVADLVGEHMYLPNTVYWIITVYILDNQVNNIDTTMT